MSIFNKEVTTQLVSDTIVSAILSRQMLKDGIDKDTMFMILSSDADVSWDTLDHADADAGCANNRGIKVIFTSSASKARFLGKLRCFFLGHAWNPWRDSLFEKWDNYRFCPRCGRSQHKRK